MKILIWDKDFSLKDSGGPAGYLYKIHEHLKQHPADEIIFYSDVFASKGVHESRRRTIGRIVTGRLPLSVLWGHLIRRLTERHFKNIHTLFHAYYYVASLTEEEIALIDSVDYVHFHILSSVLRYYPYLKNSGTKTILTTHTPEPNILEMEGYMPSVKSLTRFKWIKNKLLKREAFSYEAVDYIMLPVRTAQEAYTTDCRILKETFSKLQDKIFYVPTAVQETFAINEDKRREYERLLSSRSFKVCFIGRHNHIKGYDKLQEIAKACWQEKRDITFVVGGLEKPMTRLNDSRWIELGWVDTNALLENIDVFVLPNKQTYFDLILLEVIRQGVPCVISKTGGNKWFIDRKIKGIYGYEYDDIHTAANLIVQLSDQINTEEWTDIRSSCQVEFKKNFTLGKYIGSYLSRIKSLG